MKKIGWILVSLTMAYIIFLAAAPGHAADYTVSTTSDSDCSDSDCDFQSALNAASGNDESDVINVQPGTYDASSAPPVWNTTKNFGVVINGSTAGTPIIIDGGGAGPCMLIYTDNALPGDDNADVTINNITFRNGFEGSSTGAGLQVTTIAANISVESCVFSNNTAMDDGGAHITTVSGRISVSGNTFAGNESTNFRGGGLAAIATTGAITIDGNMFIDNESGFNGGGAYALNDSGSITVANNFFNSNSSGTNGGGAVLVVSTGTVNLIHNTFTRNSSNFGGGASVSLNENTAAANIYNNIIFNNTANLDGDDIYVCDNCTGATTGAIVNSYNNNYTGYFGLCAATIGCTERLNVSGNIDQDPLFVAVSDPDPYNWDLHITSNSPCFDTGTASAPSSPTTDFDGDARTLGSVPDMGADETAVSSGVGSGGGGGGCFMTSAVP